VESSKLLREQNFGVAEGKPPSYNPSQSFNLKEEIAKGVYPAPHGNDEKFPDGESINELGQRAKEAITSLVLPHVWQAAKENKTGIHVAVVSHGRCISQMITELLKMSAKHEEERDYRGLLNTAWTRVVIDIEVCALGQR
jgi:broad specificity phosphatase PhoE